jgi:DNA repair exonuclease SbcCD ATPase subunit
MLNVNVSQIKSSAEELKKTLDKYEENVMILAKQMQDCEVEWHDDNSENFFQKIEKQKSELKEFLVCLKKVDTTYVEIVNKILNVKSNIRTLYVNESYKNNIKNAYTTAINNINSIRSKLNGLSTYFCTYYERGIINSEINRMANTAAKLEKAKDNIDDLFNDFAVIESEIIAAIAKIEINKIDPIDFAEYL